MANTGTTIDGSSIPISAVPFVADLQLASHSDLITRSINIASSVCPDFTDFSSGSPSLALMNVKAFSDLYLQWLIYVVFLNSRLFTATKTAVDSFINDFGLTRLPATYAAGVVTFGRFTATNQMIIPVGTIVQTQDGTQRFTVIADTDNPTYDITRNAFVAAPNVFSIDIVVQANNGGTQGNVVAKSISRMFSSVAGVNFVTNNVGFLNGIDGETDQAFKSRFVPYLNSRSSATGSAVINAILSVNPGLTYQILENANGTWPYVAGDPNSGLPKKQFGFFTVYIDSGTSTVTDSVTIRQVQTAINIIRPLSIDFWTTVPSVVLVDIEYLLEYQSGYNISTVRDVVKVAVIKYVNTLAVGATLNYFRLATIIDETLGVKNIVFLVVAGQTGNVGCAPGTIIKLGELAYE